jgi:dihydrolipoamide dehydrogenase
MPDIPYDVVVIGGGPGGYVAAIRAAQLGLRVAVVEKERLGGVCLNWGCVPTKSLLRNAEVIGLLGQGEQFGFSVQGFEANYAVAISRSRQISERLVEDVGKLMRNNAIEVVEGCATLTSAQEVRLGQKNGGSRSLRTRNVIVATGSRARSIPGLKPDGERVLTSREAVVMSEVPASVVVVGAGPIGMEFAHIWSTYGADVTVVEMLPRVLPLEDEEVSGVVERAFKRRKVKILTSTRVVGIDPAASGVRLRVSSETGGAQTLEAERVLVAIGVRPNSEGMGLESVGVKLDRGNVQIDDRMRTNVPGVYAIGDVTGKLALAHVASAQGIVAAEAIAGVDAAKRHPVPLQYEMMPRCTYCQPQVASLGLTEAQATERGHRVKAGKYYFLFNGKAQALNEREGFVKIVADEVSGEIVGAHLVGPEVTELLPELALARTWELTPDEIGRTVHAHPTLSEAIVEAARAVFGKAIHG